MHSMPEINNKVRGWLAIRLFSAACVDYWITNWIIHWEWEAAKTGTQHACSTARASMYVWKSKFYMLLYIMLHENNTYIYNNIAIGTIFLSNK